MADVELDDVIPPFTGTVLESMIRQSLEMYLLDNALFLANRLIALSNSSPRAILLLADCYMRKEQFNRVSVFVFGTINLINSFLLLFDHPSTFNTILITNIAYYRLIACCNRTLALRKTIDTCLQQHVYA